MVKRRQTNVLEDDFHIVGDGVYCIFPFDSFDLNNKGLFKIGISAGGSFYNRLMGAYHTYLPMGWYPVAFIEFNKEHPIPDDYQGMKKLSYYKKIESYIFDNIKARRITSNARSVKGGQTEWVYTHQKEVHKIFEEASKIYGGEMHEFKLNKAIFDKEKREKKVIFEGKINFV